MGRIKIIGGEHRSRTVEFPDNIIGLRPTTNRIRETLFNWLNQDLSGKVCLDLFAGSGGLGLEAASRNAKSLVMIEKNRQVINYLDKTIKLLRLNNVKLIHCDAIEYLSKFDEIPDIIFLDPPYGTGLLDKSLNIISNNKEIFKNATIYLEYQTQPKLNGFEIIKSSKAGVVHYALIKRLLDDN